MLLPLLLIAITAAQDSTARVDSLFARWNTRESPGCAVAVARDGRPVLTRAYGMADLELDAANTPATIFEAGSISKQFTAAAVILLAQQGKLSLDDDVRKHVPELPDYGTPITIRHLLNHTSGLRDWGSVAAIGGWPRGRRVHSNFHALDILKRQRGLNYRPGEEYLYSNSNYNLLAIIVDRVSGMSFAEFTRRQLFEPLGMTHTQWRDDYTRIVKGRAQAYAGSGARWRLAMPFENVHGNGGLLTTVDDLLKWNANLNSPAVGGAGLVAELTRQGRLTNGRIIAYASGLFVDTYRGVPRVSHGGATGGYRAWLARYPAQRLSVALLCNAGDVDGEALGPRVADVFLGIPEPERPAPRRARVSAEVLAARAGLYRSVRAGGPVRLVVQDGKLMESPGQELIPQSGTEFLVPRGVRVVFDVGRDGRTTGMRGFTPEGDTVAYERVAEWSPAPAELEELAGAYQSDEAEVTAWLAVKGGKLVARDRYGQEEELTPVYPDGFRSPAGLVRFSRGPDGKVTGFGVTVQRARNVRFERR